MSRHPWKQLISLIKRTYILHMCSSLVSLSSVQSAHQTSKCRILTIFTSLIRPVMHDKLTFCKCHSICYWLKQKHLPVMLQCTCQENCGTQVLQFPLLDACFDYTKRPLISDGCKQKWTKHNRIQVTYKQLPLSPHDSIQYSPTTIQTFLQIIGHILSPDQQIACQLKQHDHWYSNVDEHWYMLTTEQKPQKMVVLLMEFEPDHTCFRLTHCQIHRCQTKDSL